METDSKAVELIYEDIEIHNLFSGEKNVMINATEMAKVFGKRIDVFLKSDHAKAFIKVLEFTPNGVNSNYLKPDEIVKKNHRYGTYFHEILALKFASWLDPKFEVWVYSKIKEVLYGNAERAAEKISAVALQEAKIKKLRDEILENGSDDAKKLLAEESFLVEMKKSKNKAVSIFVKSNQTELPFGE